MSTTSTSSGWNRSTSTPKPAPKKPSAMRGVVAGLVVVALAAACVVVFMGKGEKPVEKVEKERGRIKEVTPAASRVADRYGKPTAADRKGGVAKWGEDPAPTIGNGIETFDDAAELPTPEQPPQIQVFDNTADQILAMVSVTDGTGTMPPTPLSPQDEKVFRASLERPIKINPDDPDDVKAIKQRVIEARQTMKELLDSGESFNSVIREHEKLAEENFQIRFECVQEARKIFESGDVEGAEAYVKKMNFALPQMGIKEIEMPKTREQHFQEFLERAAELKAMKEAR